MVRVRADKGAERMSEHTARPVSGKFIEAMEAGLAHGREMGRIGWDTHWMRYPSRFEVKASLYKKFDEEVGELRQLLAFANSDPVELLREAADVANLAMMLADAAQEEKADA